MKKILFGCVLLSLLAGCSAVTNYRRYELFLGDG